MALQVNQMSLLTLICAILILIPYVQSSCRKTVMCTREGGVRPRCGADGVTYNHSCEVATAECEQGKSIPILHFGKCKSEETKKERPCNEHGTKRACIKAECQIPDCVEFDGTCKLVDSKPTCECRTDAPKIFDPQCGADGITYGNIWKLKNAACKQRKAIPIAHEGKCKSEETKKPGRLNERVTLDLLIEAECQIPDCVEFGGTCKLVDSKPTCECRTDAPKIFDPQCGADGITYGNKWERQIAECEQRKSIKFAHEGKCKSEAKQKPGWQNPGWWRGQPRIGVLPSQAGLAMPKVWEYDLNEAPEEYRIARLKDAGVLDENGEPC